MVYHTFAWSQPEDSQICEHGLRALVINAKRQDQAGSAAAPDALLR